MVRSGKRRRIWRFGDPQDQLLVPLAKAHHFSVNNSFGLRQLDSNITDIDAGCSGTAQHPSLHNVHSGCIFSRLVTQ